MSDLAITRDGQIAGDRLQQLQRAAAQFETFFLKQILQGSEAEKLGGLFEQSPAMKQFQDLLHDGLAERGAGRLGVAELIVEDLADRAGLQRLRTDRAEEVSR
mgnify:CR=1 FL=1